MHHSVPAGTLFSGLQISPNTAEDLMCLLNENQGQDLQIVLEPKYLALHFYFWHLYLNINDSLLVILSEGNVVERARLRK